MEEDSKLTGESDSEARLPGNGAKITSADSGDQLEELYESNSGSEQLNEKLLHAADFGDHEGVSRVLGEGAEITCRDSDGKTGLHVGAMEGHDSVVKIFLEAGIDVNIRDGADTKWTALINAAYWDNISCLKLLLDNGADPDIRGEKDYHRHGWTALMYTAFKNYPDLATELLIKGADLNILNSSGESAIQLAQENDSHDAAKLLDAWGNQEALNQEMMTAARQGRERLVSGLLRAGADVQTRDESGETGLELAMKRGHKEAAEAFLNHGIIGFDREECDKIIERNMKLIEAAKSGDHEGMSAALGEGAEITYKALINAGSLNEIYCLQILLDRGANPDLKDEEDGQTVLMHAAKNNNIDIIAELLVKGADLNVLNNAGKSTIQLAKEEYSHDAVKLLEVWGNQEALNKEMMRAARQGRGRLVSGLLRFGADLQATDEEGNTVLSLMNTGLMIAATEGSTGNIN